MKAVLKGFAFVLGLLCCTAFGFFWRDIGHGQPPSAESFARLVGRPVYSAKMGGAQVFDRNYQRILADYSGNVKPNDLKFAGIEGMVASLGDPHTIFLPPQEASMFSDETKANFGGVGARLGADPLGAKAAKVFQNGPAWSAGMRSGNVITAVDGVSMAGYDLEDIVERIKGKEGTIVKLTVVQSTKGKPIVLTIKRARIVAPTVESNIIPNTGIGYMQISQFSEPTAQQFNDEISKLEGDNIKGLIIDLRGNPGGLLEIATEMLSRFVEDKVVVKMRFRNGSVETERTDSGELHNFRYPIVVLIDEDSASAAEIFAGCLHDYGKITLVGTKSYGKASVQNVFPLVDRSSAKITIAKYYLPDNEYIGRQVDADGVKISGGLTPDVPVELNTNVQVTFGDPATDNQLAKAIQVIKSKESVPITLNEGVKTVGENDRDTFNC
jgi:carboxyl-terminal processing protease